MRGFGLFRGRLLILAALGALALALAACGGDLADQSGGVGDVAGQPPPAADEALKGGVSSDSVSGGETGQDLPSVTDRKIVRTATLELSVEDVGGAVQEIDTIATTAGGFVSGSSVFVEPADDTGAETQRTQTATITIRVPSGAYAGVMAKLRGIAKEVESETSEASEVTEEYTDLQSRLRNLEATERAYLELLNKAATIPDILSVQDRLNSVRLEIEQVQGRINVLDDLTDLATITVKLRVPAVVAQEKDQGWAEEAWSASWEASQDAAVVLGTIAIAGGVLLLWLVPLALVGGLGWRLFGKRLADVVSKLYRA